MLYYKTLIKVKKNDIEWPNFTDSNELEKFVDDMYDEIIVPTIRLVDFINFLNPEDNSIVLKLAFQRFKRGKI